MGAIPLTVIVGIASTAVRAVKTATRAISRGVARYVAALNTVQEVTGRSARVKSVAINRSDVLTSAIGVLDRSGLPDLTMRRVAADLGVAPGALYWHIPNKQSLLAAIADTILADPSLAAAASKSRMRWDRQLTGYAHALRAVLRKHRDGAEVVSASLASQLGTSNLQAQIAEIAASAGAAPADANAVGLTLTHFVVGFTFEEQTREAMARAGAAAGELDQPGTDRAFAGGVDLIVDGLRARTVAPA
ncbi:TetR family transcriptional regulator [Tsukamurella asaccharolytica]|uniref:TetR family transcriptional regulator n=1 Tax=Tsukamurella asaccharolytica TaxID=2592067 RepID=A0A5C5RCU4_9ACTN|nr:TetR family transcriptional regulator [Tsukamurella asaccharolytica]